MENQITHRRGFLGKLAAALGGLALIPGLARPALAGRSSRRRYGFGGYGYGYGYGYGPGFAPYGRPYRRSSYRRGFGGYGYGYPGPGAYGGYGGPYVQPYAVPVLPPPIYGPGFYGPPRGIYLRLNGPARPRVADALSLLEV
ncbi:MAG TPA: hypothetical protein VF590_10270 [Isosphaeraceae bacterium]|jgi:hypothetical protein